MQVYAWKKLGKVESAQNTAPKVTILLNTLVNFTCIEKHGKGWPYSHLVKDESIPYSHLVKGGLANNDYLIILVYMCMPHIFTHTNIHTYIQVPSCRQCRSHQ